VPRGPGTRPHQVGGLLTAAHSRRDQLPELSPGGNTTIATHAHSYRAALPDY
jgi:hypothetical protein